MYQNDNILEKMIETYIIMNDLYTQQQCNKLLKQLATQIDYLATENAQTVSNHTEISTV
jgi:hypothetical protein